MKNSFVDSRRMHNFLDTSMTPTLAASPENTRPISGSAFKHARTWWLTIALLIVSCESSLFTVAQPQGNALMNVKKYYDVSSPYLFLSTLVYYLIIAGLLIGRLRLTLVGMLRQKTLLCWALLSLLSTLWSQEPGYTLKKIPYLFSLLILAWLFAMSYTPEEQISVVLVVGLMISVSSAAMAILLPHYGLDVGGEWKGVFAQKNHLGQAMVFLLSGALFRTDRRHQKLWALAGIFGLVLVVLSRSVGALILAVLMIVVRIYGPLVRGLRKDRLPLALYAGACGILVATVGRGIFLAILGKDSTLTGRTSEWSVLISFAMQHFWLGYGYEAFWNGSGDSLQAMRLVGGAMRGADSGYLDTLLELGFVGLILVFAMMFGAIRNFIRLISSERMPLEVYWYFGIVLITFIGSFTEGILSGLGRTPTLLFYVSCAGLYRLNNFRRRELEDRYLCAR